MSKLKAVTSGVMGVALLVIGAGPAFADVVHVAPVVEPQVAPVIAPQIAPEVAPQIMPAVVPHVDHVVAPQIEPHLGH